MRFDWWTLGLQTVNFTILVWLLHHFLYKPVLRMIDARRAEIEKQYADAGAAGIRVKDELAAIVAQRAGITAERDATLEAARAQAEDLAKARHAQAEAEAASLLEGARKTLAMERGKAIVDTRTTALDLGTELASRLLSEVPVKLRTEAWLERIEDYFTALPKPEVDALLRQLDDGSALTVVTAAPLAPDIAEAWRARVRRSLSDGTAIAFDVDPDLIAGAELHFPSAVLRFSWKSALAAARSEVEAR
jgi:F-type H+-transporting ATPase subunit b